MSKCISPVHLVQSHLSKAKILLQHMSNHLKCSISALKFPLCVLGLIYSLYSIKDTVFKIYVFSLKEIYSDGGKANPQVT